MSKIIFLMISSGIFGVLTELLSSGLKDGYKNKSIPFNGNISLLMIPWYMILLPFLFPIVFENIKTWEHFIRFAVYGPLFMFFEVIIGWFYDFFFGWKLWDYSNCNDVILKYTRKSLFWAWGWCGLWFEFWYDVTIFLSKFIVLKFF